MKKFILSVWIFLVTFICSYIGLCYLVPSLRIKLYADTTTYFIKSISHMALFKSIISLVIVFALASVSYLIAKKVNLLQLPDC